MLLLPDKRESGGSVFVGRARFKKDCERCIGVDNSTFTRRKRRVDYRGRRCSSRNSSLHAWPVSGSPRELGTQGLQLHSVLPLLATALFRAVRWFAEKSVQAAAREPQAGFDCPNERLLALLFAMAGNSACSISGLSGGGEYEP